MQLNTTYGQIWRISFPIMLGSATQNVIALTDSVFLYHLSENDFASIGFVGVFYLIIAAIGYGFSKGGQIIIARKYGQNKYDDVGTSFYAMVCFELFLACCLFLFMYFGTPWFFSLLIDSDIIYEKSLEYIQPRSFGVFFSYVGVALVALYTGVAKTWFIIVDTLILAVVNIVLNYGLIFGHFGLPSMGIAGAGLASSISEVVAFIVFVLFMFMDPLMSRLGMFTWPKIDFSLIRQMLSISSPVVIQSVVGMGSWFLFFSLIENLGERSLAITNLGRITYLILSIPAWGFSSGINTLVSNFIGSRKSMAVWPIIKRTSFLCALITMIISIPVLVFPEYSLYPLLGSEDMSLIREAQPVFYVLLVIIFFFSIGVIFFNGLTGTGLTLGALKLQTIATLAYLVYVYYVIKFTDLGLTWAWTSEIVYWIIVIIWSFIYLRRRQWKVI